MTTCILIVEDDDAIRHVLADALQEAGFAVATATNGLDALDAIEQHPPDAILLDLMMPEMDGWDFLEKCRGDPRSAHIPVGIMSGAPKMLKTANAWGVQVAIGKPFTIDTLIDQVDRLVEPIAL